MSPDVPKEWLGQLNWKTLFPDSKSEGVYPVLTTSDGQDYRVRLKDAPPDAQVSLRHLDGSQIRLEGYADDLRGHWRINVPWLGEGLTITPVISAPNDANDFPDLTPLNTNSPKES
jgi:hypothetical protein